MYKKPQNFLPAGNVISARFSDSPPTFLRRGNQRGRRRQGLIYQAKAGVYLNDRYSPHFRNGPWVIFNGDRWCQPDGLLIDVEKSRIIVTEFKLKHCSEAWYQLFELYIPVVRNLFPGWEVVGVEICRWFDPATRVPATPVMRMNPFDALPDVFNVHIWNP
jgi:hypothetical protein